MSTYGKPWTDEEFGHVIDRADWPAAKLAADLGRSVESIYNLRHRLRKGWTPKNEGYIMWTEAEDSFLLSNPQMSAPEISKQLKRTVSSINQRRMLLKRTRDESLSFRGNFSPFMPGARPLLAQTCPDCGLLLQEKWFQADKRGRCRTCKRCRETDRQSRGIFRKRSPETAKKKDSKMARYHHWQQVTIDRAENRGQPWTEKDMQVLADPDLTIFQKALMLKRTWAGVQVAAQKSGFKNKVGLGDPERDQWLIDNPNADRVEEIRAQFASMTDALVIPEPDLETAGAPKRPDFDWED